MPDCVNNESNLITFKVLLIQDSKIKESDKVELLCLVSK